MILSTHAVHVIVNKIACFIHVCVCAIVRHYFKKNLIMLLHNPEN